MTPWNVFQARYVMKYDHKAGALVLKMTDDAVCLQFKTDAAQVLKFRQKNFNGTISQELTFIFRMLGKWRNLLTT